MHKTEHLPLKFSLTQLKTGETARPDPPKMRAFLAPILALVAVLMSQSVVYCGDLPATTTTFLSLHRAFPPTHRVQLDRLRARDRVRHGRLLQNVVGGVADFSVEGSSDPYLVG